MRFAVLVLLVAFSFLSGGCSHHDGSAPAITPRPEPKPLPACEELVDVELQTAETPLARHRDIQIAYHQKTPYVKYSLDQGEVRPPVKLDRGITYDVTISTQSLDKTYDFQSKVIEVPTCDKRQDYQNANPTYEEPIVLVPTK